MPLTRPSHTPPLIDDVALHTMVRLPASMRMHRDTAKRDACVAIEAMAPTGTLGEAAVGQKHSHGPLVFAQWGVARRISLTRHDLTFGDERSDVSFTLSLETSATSGAMVEVVEGL